MDDKLFDLATTKDLLDAFIKRFENLEKNQHDCDCLTALILKDLGLTPGDCTPTSLQEIRREIALLKIRM